METFNFPYHKYSVDYPESGFKMELGGSYRYNAEPSAPDQRIFKLYFDTMLRYEAKYTKSGIIPSGNVNGDVWVDTGTQNLMLRSQELDTAFWTKNNTTVTANSGMAPNGTVTSDKVRDTLVNAVHNFSTSISLTAGNYTFSTYAAADERSVFNLFKNNSGTNQAATFNLGAGTVSAFNNMGYGESLTKSMAPVQGAPGWYRCQMKFSTTGGVCGIGLQLAGSAYLPSSVGGLHIWGLQLEKSEGMGTYLPTTTSAVSTTGINKGYRFSNGVWVPTTNPSKLNLFSNPEINLGLLEDFYLRHKMWKKFIYPHPIYGDLAVRFSRPLILPKGYTDGNGTVEPFELEFIEVPGGL